MTRKENALLEMVKRGGTINERKIACEKLMLLTGKNYSYLLPKEEIKNPKNELAIKIRSFLDIIAQIKNNFPIYFDPCQNLWRGSKGLIIDQVELEDMPYFQHQLIKEALRVTS